MSKWTADRDQRLLLLLIDNFKVDTATSIKLAAAYKVKYGAIDSYEPTPRAITEHIASLKKTANGGGGGKTSGKATPMKQASTPKKSLAVKTPTSSAKRPRKTAMSEEEDADDNDDDDSETELKRLKLTPSGPRTLLSRRSKSVSKSYKQDDDGSGDFAEGSGRAGPSGSLEEVNGRLDSIPFKLSTAVTEGRLTPNGKVVGVGKAKVPVDGFESDGSNFSGSGFGLGY